jgi:hypothetical protein
MHVLEHVLARSFKESQSQCHSNAEQPRSRLEPSIAHPPLAHHHYTTTFL